MNLDRDLDVPPLPDLNRLPAGCLKRLRQTKLSEIEPKNLQLLMANQFVRQAKSTARRGPFKLSYGGLSAFLCWKTAGPVFTNLCLSAAWTVLAGFIRDQLYHIICWAYASSDLTSVIRIIRGWEDRYIPLCTWYMTRHADPNMLGKDGDAKKGHVCYGRSLAEALEFIEEEGIPKELPQYRSFDCRKHPPSSSGRKHKINSVLKFNTLEEALAHLHIQPIGAALIAFPELWVPGNEIYYGPLAKNTYFVGYHDVVILKVEMYKGEQVALCKMSNGKQVADGGYVRVSLKTMYMVVGAEEKTGERIVFTPRPMHLLSDFQCPLMDEAPPRVNRKRNREQHKAPKRSEKRRR